MSIFKKVDLSKIKLLRENAGLSYSDMATYLGYDSSNGYYYLEIGRGKFSAENLAKVADKFLIPIADLFFEDSITNMVINQNSQSNGSIKEVVHSDEILI